MPRPLRLPPPTTICLVRHGTTPTTGTVLPGRAPGLSLSDRGRQEAEAAAERLSALRRVGAIYASPLERAQETAAPIARRLDLPVKTEPGLLECDFGTWTGADLKTLAKLPAWTTVQRWPSGWRFPDGESFGEMQLRLSGCLASIVARHPGETVVAVSHADPIKAALAGALGVPLDLFQRIQVAPASVSVVSYGVSGPAVLAVNTTASLVELLPAPARSSPRSRPARRAQSSPTSHSSPTAQSSTTRSSPTTQSSTTRSSPTTQSSTTTKRRETGG